MNKKLFGIVAAVVLLMALAVPAFAASTPGADDKTATAAAAGHDAQEAASEAKDEANDAAKEAKDDLKESSQAEVEVENESGN